MNILITGASGFIGSHVVDEALRRGMEVWAAVRPHSSRKYLKDSRIHFIELDLSSEERLINQLKPYCFDYIIYAAGLTKSVRQTDFFQVNVDGLKHFVSAILKLDMPIKRFIYLSSLGVYGAVKEAMPHADITEHDVQKPNTAYGKSKLVAEQYLDSIGNDFPYIVLRPTGVYGPRETDYYMMMKNIRNHLNLTVGFCRQDITFVYVDDLVQAIFLAFDHGMSGRKYFVTDGEVYQSAYFGQLIRKTLGNSWCITLTLPMFVLRLATEVGELIGKITGKITALNRDKYNIMKQRNWRCDIEPTMDELGYHPHFKLERGVEETIKWYKANNWL